MISRRILRIKVLQSLYSHFHSEKTFIESKKELTFSVNKTVDLFYYISLLIIDVKEYAKERIEIAKNKTIPTDEDLNPNLNFINNRVIQQIEENEKIQRFLNAKKLSWINYPELIKSLFIEISNHPLYKEYMELKSPTYNDEKQFIVKVFNKIVADYEPLYHNLEEQSLFWNSEIEYAITSIAKNIKPLTEEYPAENDFLNISFDDDDSDFVNKLFSKVVTDYEDYKKIIDEYTTNWDVERIAFIDILIMIQALSEIMIFPTIPSKVSLNEYIDIAKSFSTANSGTFINGVLDKIINKLKAENKIQKYGTGLLN